MNNVLVLVVFTCIGVCFLTALSGVPAYMDELFHVWQTQQYCSGHYSQYHPKITTPPTLYVISALLASLVRLPCTPIVLRSINFLFSLLNLAALYQLDESGSPTLSVLSQWLLPPLYFFSFLFYTDQLSLLCVLLLIRHRHDHSCVTLGLSLSAVLVRQSNIVWVFYSYLLPYCRRTPTLRQLLCGDWPFVVTGAASCAFFLYNGSLALGDKTAHQPVLHIPQILYFFAFIFVLNLHRTLPHFKHIPSLLSCGLVLLAIYFFTYEHSYLVSDHRHYTFYLWRHFFKRFPLQPYLYTPIYLAALGWFSRQFTLNWSYLFFFCTFLALVPNKLLELRYFIIPGVLLTRQLRMTEQYSISLLFHVTCLLVLNLATLSVFIYFPFYSTAYESQQRLMW